MITAIVVLSGVALIQLYFNVVLYCTVRMLWKEKHDTEEELLPIEWEDNK